MESLGETEIGSRIAISVAYGVLIGCRRTGILVEFAVTFGKFPGYLSAKFTLFIFGELVVDFSVCLGRVEIFAAFKLFVGSRELGA